MYGGREQREMVIGETRSWIRFLQAGRERVKDKGWGSRRCTSTVEGVCVVVAQLCPTLCDPMDCSLPGSSVHGILQVRILEWVAISFSRGSS